MVTQLVASRLSAPYIGTSHATWTAIIGVTLAGIALGNYIGGRLADGSCSRRRLATLLIIAALVEGSVLLASPLVGSSGLLAGLPQPARILVHVFVVFLPPFTCLGTISPVIARRALNYGAATGRTMGDVYAASIAGSILGTLITGYFLLAWMSHSGLILSSVAVLGGMAFIYGALSLRPDPFAMPHTADPSRHAPTDETFDWRVLALPIATVFLASAAVMALELVAARMLARNFGSSLYTWTTIIAAILAGMSLGGYLGGRWADRFENMRLLGVLFVASALTCVVMPLLNAVHATFPILWDYAWPTQIRLYCIAVFFVPATLLGAIPPVVARIALERHGAPGRTVGIVYAWGSIGSIAGTLISGFLLIDWFGVKYVVLLLAALLTVLGLRFQPRSWLVRGWTAFVALLIVSAVAPWPAVQALSMNLALRPFEPPHVLYADESRYAYVRVEAADPDRPSLRKFIIDALVHSMADVDNPRDLKYQHTWYYAAVLDAVYPSDAPINTMVIGGGGYAFPRYLEVTRPGGYHESIEIDPAVTEAAHAAFGLPRDTDIAIFDQDGRTRVANLIHRKTRGEAVPEFDVILGDSINDLSVPFHLTTQEFTQQIHDLLKEDGMYLLNLVDWYESGQFLGAVVNTCAAVFPHVTVFSSGGELDRRDTFVVVRSKTPRDLSAVPETVRRQYRGQGIMLNETQRAALAARSNGLVLTDDYAPVDNLLAAVVTETEEKPLLRRLQRADRFIASGELDRAIAELRLITERSDTMPVAYELLGVAYRDKGNLKASIEALETAVAGDPSRDSAHHNLALSYHAAGMNDRAVAAWREALKLTPDYRQARINLGVALYKTQRFDDAQAVIETAIVQDPTDIDAQITLAAICFDAGDLDRAAAVLTTATERAPDNPQLYRQLASVYARQGKLAEARTAAERCIALGGGIPPALAAAIRAPE